MIIPRRVAGICAVGVFWTGAVGKTGVAAGVSQPASERSRLVVTISQKSGGKYFKCFILYSFMYIPILAFAHKKIPSQRERIRLVEWIGFGQGNPWSGGSHRRLDAVSERYKKWNRVEDHTLASFLRGAHIVPKGRTMVLDF